MHRIIFKVTIFILRVKKSVTKSLVLGQSLPQTYNKINSLSWDILLPLKIKMWPADVALVTVDSGMQFQAALATYI